MTFLVCMRREASLEQDRVGFPITSDKHRLRGRLASCLGPAGERSGTRGMQGGDISAFLAGSSRR